MSAVSWNLSLKSCKKLDWVQVRALLVVHNIPGLVPRTDKTTTKGKQHRISYARKISFRHWRDPSRLELLLVMWPEGATAEYRGLSDLPGKDLTTLTALRLQKSMAGSLRFHLHTEPCAAWQRADMLRVDPSGWITYQGTWPWKGMNLPLSAALSYLVSFIYGWGLLKYC